ncbi:ferrous iron transport protein A [Cyanobium sp. ATX 6A2]|jgi:ferrous iron transport protein A|uniref:FeoA family protein n=1 Tax=Cyanobium sp. ATX 6A2 TaxID=2823700 RepID=UPI0020CF20CF|nr:FeoA family protein [Cyanobium sp. ATX 6A2]MCP9888201.1 ferrous iron transport protein A [Cyanobium sp. ATX 6A2]
MPLSAAPAGCSICIESLPSQPSIQARLMAIGIKPGARVQVLRRGQPGGILHVACGIMEFMIRHEHAAEMEVSV